MKSSLPLIYVGGMISKDKMEEVLDNGFVAFQMARALINDTDFVNKLMSGEVQKAVAVILTIVLEECTVKI